MLWEQAPLRKKLNPLHAHAAQGQACQAAFTQPSAHLTLTQSKRTSVCSGCFSPHNDDVGLFSLNSWEIKWNNSEERVTGLLQIMGWKGTIRLLYGEPYAGVNLRTHFWHWTLKSWPWCPTERDGTTANAVVLNLTRKQGSSWVPSVGLWDDAPGNDR